MIYSAILSFIWSNPGENHVEKLNGRSRELVKYLNCNTCNPFNDKSERLKLYFILHL